MLKYDHWGFKDMLNVVLNVRFEHAIFQKVTPTPKNLKLSMDYFWFKSYIRNVFFFFKHLKIWVSGQDRNGFFAWICEYGIRKEIALTWKIACLIVH